MVFVVYDMFCVERVVDGDWRDGLYFNIGLVWIVVCLLMLGLFSFWVRIIFCCWMGFLMSVVWFLVVCLWVCNVYGCGFLDSVCKCWWCFLVNCCGLLWWVDLCCFGVYSVVWDGNGLFFLVFGVVWFFVLVGLILVWLFFCRLNCRYWLGCFIVVLVFGVLVLRCWRWVWILWSLGVFWLSVLVVCVGSCWLCFICWWWLLLFGCCLVYSWWCGYFDWRCFVLCWLVVVWCWCW